RQRIDIKFHLCILPDPRKELFFCRGKEQTYREVRRMPRQAHEKKLNRWLEARAIFRNTDYQSALPIAKRINVSLTQRTRPFTMHYSSLLPRSLMPRRGCSLVFHEGYWGISIG